MFVRSNPLARHSLARPGLACQQQRSSQAIETRMDLVLCVWGNECIKHRKLPREKEEREIDREKVSE